MFNIIFPKSTGQKYYNLHFLYVLNMFKEMGSNIKLEERDGFVVTIDKKDFLFDYSDSSECFKCQLPVFKFHCQEESDNIFAFPPISFHNWKHYNMMLDWIKYRADGFVSYRQRPYGNAKQRRIFVKQILTKNFNNLQTSPVSQIKYFQEVNDVLLAVFVPGWCNNMLDRAQFQYMALGCCTISPKLPELLPFGKVLIPNIHYILCKDDYSDVVSLINEYSLCKEICMEIGNNAKELFKEVAIPRSVGKWIKTKL